MPIRGSSSMALRPRAHRKKWTKAKKRPKIKPFAKEVDEKHSEWKLYESYTGRTNKGDHVMCVPMDDSERSQSIRLHEQLHNKFSPNDDWVKKNVRDAGIDDQCYQIAEDLRLAFWANKKGVAQTDVVERESLLRSARNAVNTGSDSPIIDATKIALSLSGQGKSRDTYLNALKVEKKEFYEKVASMVTTCDAYMSGSETFREPRSAVTIANYLMVRKAEEEKLEKERKKREKEAAELTEKFKKEFKTSASEEQATSLKDAIDMAVRWMPNIDSLSPGMVPKIIDNEAKSGKLVINIPPMPRRVYPKNREGRVALSKDYGTVPSRIHNWCISKRIFTKTVKFVPGATVLIDASGSMRGYVNPTTIQEIINIAPGSKIAFYSGTSYGGDLVVVADNGRAANAESWRPLIHGGNVVDLPSVKWLSEQKGPRYWVTDLGVTGIGDAGSETILAACLSISISARIKIVHTPKSLYEAMKITQAISSGIGPDEE